MSSGPVDTVKSGSVAIPIYHLEARQCYLAKWNEGDAAKRKQGKDLASLKKDVRKIAKRISSGTMDLTDITPEQATVCREVVRRGITLADLDTIASVKPRTVQEAIDRFLQAKADAGTSSPYRRTLATHLQQFAKTFGSRLVSSITPEEIDQWLQDMAPGLRTRRNKRSCLVSLWRWARDKGMLAQEMRTVAERADAPSSRKQKRKKTVETWTADELKTILEVVPPAYLPWVVLSAFAGLRTNELFLDDQDPEDRKAVLQWEDIILTGKESRVIVSAEVAKTAEMRTAPICPTLRAWLKTFRNRTGPVCPTRAPWKVPWKSAKNPDPKSVIDTITEAVGGQWRKNALRHSFGTYRVLEVGSVGPVALEMGNSERMVKSHYYHPGRTKMEAEQWFALSPAKIDRSLRASA